MRKFNRNVLVILSIILLSGFFYTSNAQTDKETRYLQTLANMTGQNMYLAYVYMGTLADAYMYKAYKQTFALNLAKEYIEYLGIAKDELNKLISSGFLDEVDIQYIKKQITAYEYLIIEADQFSKYMETGESKYVEQYEINRRRAWATIAQILGLPENVDGKK